MHENKKKIVNKHFDYQFIKNVNLILFWLVFVFRSNFFSSFNKNRTFFFSFVFIFKTEILLSLQNNNKIVLKTYCKQLFIWQHSLKYATKWFESVIAYVADNSPCSEHFRDYSNWFVELLDCSLLEENMRNKRRKKKKKEFFWK